MSELWGVSLGRACAGGLRRQGRQLELGRHLFESFLSYDDVVA
jgi:hypothetical protein